MAGFSKLVTPYSTSEMHALCNAARGEFNGNSDALVVVGAELERELRKIGGRRALLGLDANMAARQVRRNVVHAALLQEEAAKAMMVAWQKFQGFFVATSSQRQGFNLEA